MSIEVRLPALGENIDSATVTRILVKVGDTISKDQPIVELDTEKASVDVPSPFSGIVKEIRVKESDVLNVDQVVLILEETGDAAKPPAEKKPEPAAPAEPPSPKVETEKTPPVEQKREIAAAPKPVEPAEPAQPAQPAEKALAQTEQTEPLEVLPEPAQQGVPAAPSLRRMARELGIDIHAVSGTGPSGRISKEDVRNYARSIILNSSASGIALRPGSLPDFSRWGEVERKAMSGIRRAIAEHVQDAWSSIPHVTQFDSADITELDKVRESLGNKMDPAPGKVTITAIALKVVSAALRVFPQFNVSLDSEREEVISKKYCHIGVAVDTEHGLLVPVIRDVDKKNILELSVELAEAAGKARSRKLSVEEMQGGTFTITNLGGIGGSSFTPIVNSPEVAILGMSRASLQPVFRDGEFKPRLILPLALSYDHRAVDGADGARFLRWVAEALEQPLRLLL